MKRAINTSRLLSSIFRPVYYPTVGFVILFSLTYMSLLPWVLRLWILGLVYLFTVSLPSMGVYIYRRLHGWSLLELRKQKHRLVPYGIHLLCYNILMYLLSSIHMPRFALAILVVSLMIQLVCVVVNHWYKISMHSAGTGGVIGVTVAYSAIFGYNPVWWLCGAILLSGLVMSSRMILRQHTLWQVLGGTLIGVACGILGVIV